MPPREAPTIALTAREFALLESCVRRDGDVVVARAEILDHVWGIDFDGDPNIVEVYVGYLRKKIDAPFGVRDDQTVRGAGYRLVADVETDAAPDPAATAASG